MRQWLFLVLMVCALAADGATQVPPAPQRMAGVRLETIAWPAAEQHLKADAVVVLPLGARSSAHGPHLPLGTEGRLAEYLTRRVLEHSNVVVAPPFSYHYYPSVVEYPGSTSLTRNTARDLTVDVVRSLVRHGPRRFYVLNTSSVSVPALGDAARILADEGILLRYTDIRTRLESSVRLLRQQPFGGHADEIETSMMLYVDPSSVDMPKATRELGNETSPLYLTRRQGSRGTYAPRGVWGDATLATRDKGAAVVEALLKAVRTDIEDLRRAPLAAASSSASGGAPQRASRVERIEGRPGECTPADDRTIRAIGTAYALAWANQDAIILSALWNTTGDMIHPDGFIEGSAQAIRENRTTLFMRPEYRNSKHGLFIGAIRCIAPEVAVADAKWDLRGVTDARGTTMSPIEGLSTLVLKKRDGGWGIEAYRYTMKGGQNLPQPTLLNRPGFTNIR